MNRDNWLVLTDSPEAARALLDHPDPLALYPGIFPEGIVPRRLASLGKVLGMSREAAGAICDPKILAGDPAEKGMHVYELPRALAELLAPIEDEDVAAIATAWAKAEPDCVARWGAGYGEYILLEFARVCRQALSERKTILIRRD